MILTIEAACPSKFEEATIRKCNLSFGNVSEDFIIDPSEILFGEIECNIDEKIMVSFADMDSNENVLRSHKFLYITDRPEITKLVLPE